MTFGNKEDMLWGLRINIPEGDNILILVDNATGYIPSRDLAK
jgi:hypothetical protein